MIVTARQLEDLHKSHGGNGRVTLPYRARLTPLAADYVRSHGRMASEVMQTAIDRLQTSGRLPADLATGTRLWQPERLDRGVTMRPHEIDAEERPPLASLH